MARRYRRRYLIDRKVQLSLIARVVAYWIFCLYGIFFLLAAVPLVMRMMSWGGGGSAMQIIQETWAGFWPYFLASLLLLPLVIWDALRFSHRFAGPVFRMKQVLKQLADGQHVPDVQMRRGDYWQDMAAEFNRLAQRVQELQQTKSSREHEPGTDSERRDSAAEADGEALARPDETLAVANEETLAPF